MEARCITKYVRVSPMKVGIVLDLIRGKNVDEAIAILNYTPKDAAQTVLKTLKSAKANAISLSEDNDENLEVDSLYVSKAFVTQGPTLKRMRPHAQGRAFRILKKTSHITVVVKER